MLAYLDDASTARLIAGVYRERGFAPPDMFEGGLAAALESAELTDDFDLLIIDVDSTLLPIADIGALGTVLPGHVKVIALGSNDDQDYGRELIAAGASSYLVKPLTAERIEVLIFGRRRPEPMPKPDMKPDPEPRPLPASTGRVTQRQIVVIGARGGLGATSVAVNLASVIGERTRRPTLLMDLDLQFGTALLSLNLHPSEALGQMLRRPERIDDVLVRHSVQGAARHLDVLGAEEQLDETPGLDPQGMPTLMDEIGALYHYVVMDLPAHHPELIGAALTDASDVVLVGDLSLAGVRDTLRMLALVHRHAPENLKRYVVIGGAADQRHASMTPRQFEESVGQSLAAVLPYDPAVLMGASAAGRPATTLKPGSKIAKAYARFAETFLPADNRRRRRLFRFRTAK